MRSLTPHAASTGGVQQRIRATLERIRHRDRTLHAFIALDEEGAMRRAAELDALPASLQGPLHGMPVAVKEVIDVAGAQCEWGSRLHEGRRPQRHAPLVQRLLAAGAVVVGITASTEYALAAAAATVHPMDATRSPGASSSGSAAAVAAGLVPLALGTQTIGSIIRPAAYCGVVGFKPSHGRYPTAGILCLSEQLDDAGLLADRVASVIAVDRVLAGPGLADAAWRDPAALSSWMPTGLRVLDPWFAEDLSPGMRAALESFHRRLRARGIALETLQVDPDIAAAERALTDTLLTFELARRHGTTLRDAPDKVSPQLQEMMVRGEQCDALTHAEAVQAQARLSARLNAMLQPGEIALAPATVDIAPLFAEGSGSRAPQRLWTLAGMPALTLPVGICDGLPVGVQLVGRVGEDERLLRAAAWLEAGAMMEAEAEQGADV